jgi:putative spermidine/putrescine transport system permease protein
MGLGQLISSAVTVVVVIFLVAPIVIVVPMSFTSSTTLEFPPQGFSVRWYQAVFTDPVWQLRVPISVITAVSTALLATVIGTATALGLARGSFPGKRLVFAVVVAPLVVPVVVLATGMFFVWARGWYIGSIQFGGGLDGTILGLILAHTVLAIPFPAIMVSSSLRTVDRNLESAAASLGAGPWTAFRKVTLPLILPGVLAGMAFAFIASWDEAVVATFLASARVSTVPVQIFVLLRESLDPTAAAISTMLLLISIVLFLVAGAVQRHRPGGRFKGL